MVGLRYSKLSPVIILFLSMLVIALLSNSNCSSNGSGQQDGDMGAFLTHTGLVGVLFGEVGTELCMSVEDNILVLTTCESDEARYHWEVRKDFTLYNRDTDSCLTLQNEDELSVKECDSDNSDQHWLITLGPEPFMISSFQQRNKCIGRLSSDSARLRMTSCTGELAVGLGIRQPTFLGIPPFPTTSLPPTNTGSLENILELTVDGFGDVNNKYAWSMVAFRGDLYVGTLNALNWVATMTFTNDVAIDTNGTQVWKGSRNESGEWNFVKILSDGLDDTNNFGLRKMITCGTNENQEDAYILGVTMNNAVGFSLLRYDGEQWMTEFREGNFNNPPSNSGMPSNVSGRGMAVFNDHVYIGVANNKTGGKIWRRPIDEKCDWTGPWQVVTDNGFDEPFFPFQNTWFGDMVVFKNHIYTGTLNYGTGGQIWRSATGDPGRENWERVFVAGPFGEESFINVIKLFHWEKEDNIVVGGQDSRRGGTMLTSKTGDPDTFQRLFDRGITGNDRNTYLWFIENFKVGDFDRLYLYMGNNFTGYQTFSVNDLTGQSYLMESLNAFNAPNGSKYLPWAWSVDYYGGRTALNYDGQLIMGTASANTTWGFRVYAADPNPTALGHEIASGQLPGPDGPVACLTNDPGTTGIFLNNGEAWLDWRELGRLQLRTQGGSEGQVLWESNSLDILVRNKLVCFAENGNLSVTNQNTNEVLFESGPAPKAPASMVLQPDCNLQLIDSDDMVYFETGTAGQCLLGNQ